jgi:hypothetical protein
MVTCETTVTCLTEYLEAVDRVTSKWSLPTGIFPWFRGQSDAAKPPLPGVFRSAIKEHDINAVFQQRARMYIGRSVMPDSDAQWLSLMQHVGNPTRLLDWTDSAVVGLFFASQERERKDAAVWLLHPLKLNELSELRVLPASDSHPVSQSYRLAFSSSLVAPPPARPIAVSSTHVHPRMAAQRGCFTIHGTDRRSFVAQFESEPLSAGGYFQKFIVPTKFRPSVFRQLSLAGIRYGTLFPDLDGLTRELRDVFC